MTISLSLKPLVFQLGSTKSNDVIDLLRPQQNKKQIHVSCACVRNMEMFLPNSPPSSLSPFLSPSLSFSFSLGSAHVKVCGTPYTHRERQPCPSRCSGSKVTDWRHNVASSVCQFCACLGACHNSSQPTMWGVYPSQQTTQPHHIYHLPQPVCRTYQSAVHTLTKSI